MTVASVAVATAKCLFAMCDCMVDSDVGTMDCSLVLGTLQVCGHAHVKSKSVQSKLFFSWLMSN